MENNNGDIVNNGDHQPPPSYSQPQGPQQTSSSSNPQNRNYWIEQMEQVSDFRNNRQLPLARIKKIMKADPDVHMVSAEAPILFAKACEMFIVDLTMRSWQHAEESKRHTLQKSDIADAVASSFTYDFLLDIVPKNESITDPGFVAMPHPVAGGVPQFYYPPPEMVIGTPVVDGIGEYMQPPTQDEASDNGRNGGGN